MDSESQIGDTSLGTWMPDSRSNQSSVAAVVPNDQLSQVLTAVHRAGFGHRSRVVRPSEDRDSAKLFGRPLATEESLLIVGAAAAAERVRILLLGLGLERVELFEDSIHPSAVVSIDRLAFQRRPRRSRSGRSTESTQ